MSVYVPEHFRLYELLPPQEYEKYNRRGKAALQIFDWRMLYTLDALRHRYGKMLMNTWRWGGNSQWRGWRPMDCVIGAELSQHKFGRAGDIVPTAVSPQRMRDDCKRAFEDGPPHADNPFAMITCIEEAPDMSWFHFDVRNWDVRDGGLLIVNAY